MNERMVQVHKYNPTISDVHTNRQLTDISEAYYQDEAAYLASSCFPMVPVEKQSDFYYTWNRGDMFRDEARKRAPGTEVIRSGARISTTTYSCDIYEYGDDVKDEVERNADIPLNLRMSATKRVMQTLLIRRERIFTANFMATGKWTTDIVGASSKSSGQVIYWSTAATGLPIDDIEDAKRAILVNTGKEANTLVLGYDVRKALKTNAQIVDRVKYGQTPGGIAMVSDSDLAQVFGVERILVAKAIYNTANENSAGTYTMDFITGKSALLCHSAPSPGIDTPSAGMCFVNRNQFAGANGIGAVIQELRDEHKRKTNIDGFINFDLKLTAPDLGYFFSAIVQ